MAKIQFGVVVVNARGRLNGSQFSANRSGNVLQNKCSQRKGATSAQSVFRSNFSTLGRYWRTLTPEEQEANRVAASDYPYVDKFGVTRYFTGYQLLLRSNINRFVSGLSPINVVPTPPPVGFSLGTVFLIATTDVGAGSDLVVAWTGASPNPENYSVQVFNSPMVSAGVSLYSGRYVYAKSNSADIGEVAYSPVANGTQFGWVEGQRVFAKISVIHVESGVEVSSYIISTLITT